MVRRRLSLQLGLALLLVLLLPLGGTGLLTIHFVEESLRGQVRARHDQTARAAAGLVEDYLRNACGNASEAYLADLRQALELYRSAGPDVETIVPA